MTPVTNQVAEKKKARIAVAAGPAPQSDGLIPALVSKNSRGQRRPRVGQQEQRAEGGEAKSG
jgi:hypothetical protein